jgi:predicted phosphoribosyltransferase
MGWRRSPAVRFRDRTDAGRKLAEVVAAVPLVEPIVLALPRGGVPVAAEIAAALDAPLDVLVVRKVGARGQPELAVGAVAEHGEVVLDERAIAGTPPEELEAAVERQREEVARRVERYRCGRPLPDVMGADVVVVDDGIATGLTAEAAVRTLIDLGAARIVLAAPVCARSSLPRLRRWCQVACVAEPSDFGAVGAYYDDFTQVPDADVVRILGERRDGRPGAQHPSV